MELLHAGLTRRQAIAGTLGALALGAGGRPAAGAGPAAPPLASSLPAGPALDWITAVYELVRLENLTPPAAARVYAHSAIAMYEATVAAMPAHLSLGRQLTGLPAMPRPQHRGQVDSPTALAAAVRVVLESVLPFAAPATRPLLVATYEGQLSGRRTAGVTERSMATSVAHGSNIGAALARWIADDGYTGTVGKAYQPPTGAEHLWESTPPNFRPAIEPHWSQIRPLVLKTADEVEPEPHLPFSPDPASAFGQQAMTTYLQSAANTDEHRAIARFWTDNPGSFTPPFGTATGLPAGHWMMIAVQALRQRGARLDLAVEVLARTGIALHEAFLNCWTWKYRYNLLRPVTYVRRYIDPTWSTFVNTPQFPEYTSGHSVASPAAAAVLTDLLGTVAFTDESHAVRGYPSRSFTSFRHAADEAAMSRLYGGIHYPMAIEAGFAQGDAVAALVLARVRTRR